MRDKTDEKNKPSDMLSVEQALALANKGEVQGDALTKDLEYAINGGSDVVLDVGDKDALTTNNDALSESQAEMKAEENANNAPELSPLRIVVKRFVRSKLSMIGVGMLLFLLLFSFLGPVVYQQWGETTVDRSPGKIDNNWQQIVYGKDENGDPLYGYIYQEGARNPNYWADPSGNHPLGTDRSGLDVLARLMYGGRASLVIALTVILLQTLIGILMGGMAGYFGKWVDQLIMRIVEVFICVPSMPLLIIIGAIMSDPSVDVSSNVKIMVLVAVLVFFGWANIARLVRGQILQLREQEYMIAAETMGYSSARKIFKHLVPNIMPVLLVTMTLGFGGIILTEAGLSFLGFGVPPDKASWGGMLSQITQGRIVEFLQNRIQLWLVPGLLILMAVLSFNFIGDGLRDAMDPKARR